MSACPHTQNADKCTCEPGCGCEPLDQIADLLAHDMPADTWDAKIRTQIVADAALSHVMLALNGDEQGVG